MCSPMVAPGNFYDWDNDENDVQGWMLKEGCYWEEAEVNQKKRIKLKFRMIQYRETGSFSGVVYHVAATGYVVDMESRKYLLGD